VPDMPPDTLDEHGAPKAATSGLSEGRIRELGQWCLDRAEAQWRANGGEIDQVEIEEGLRIILREEVFPEFVETEFQKVMQRVFAV
jgi:hypothetical protein